MNINLNDYEIIKNDDGTILLKPFNKQIQVKSIDDLSDYNFIDSKIVSIIIDGEKYEELSYKDLLFEIYGRIKNWEKIINDTIIYINVYSESISVNFKEINFNQVMKEIFNQANKNCIGLDVAVNHTKPFNRIIHYKNN